MVKLLEERIGCKGKDFSHQDGTRILGADGKIKELFFRGRILILKRI
jgi:hypothetical protein